MEAVNEGWRPHVAEQLDFYVYLLIDPRDDDVFYVGKGVGDRCFSHLAEARKSDADSHKDYPKLATIRDVENDGQEVRIEILRHGLNEDAAFEIESVAIDLLGFAELSNKVKGVDSESRGRMTTDNLNALYGATPAVIQPDDHFMLIRVTNRFFRGISDDELYDATRRWWRVGERRNAVSHVLAVHGGVVRAVYRVDSWEKPSARLIKEDPNRQWRWGFIGQRDPQMEDRLLFTDVSAHLAQGNQNPIT
jgi:hypothetical protein